MAACAGEPTGDLTDVADGLRSLERATIDLQLEVGDTGFTIDGALAVSDERPLPVARLTYQPAGDGTATTVLLTGDDGFVEVDGVAYRLPPAQLDALRIPEGGATSALSTIRLEEWLDDTRPDGGGVYEGEGDTVVVLEDVLDLVSGLGAGEVPAVPFREVGDLEVRAVAPDEQLEELTATGRDLRFRLRLADHGEPVEVEPPESARPYAELGR